jgi:hypothetical protein
MLSKFSYIYNPQCKKYTNEYPNFTPEIYHLSTNTSDAGAYTQVKIFGQNFSFGSSIGRSVVNFGSYKSLPITFYGSTGISFVVPSNAQQGIYSVQVVNVLYPTSLYSNTVSYILM